MTAPAPQPLIRLYTKAPGLDWLADNSEQIHAAYLDMMAEQALDMEDDDE